MRKTALLLILFSIFFAPENVMAETKKAKAELAAKKETTKHKAAKKAVKPKPVKEVAAPEPAAPQTLDLKLDDKMLNDTNVDKIKENIELKSDYAPSLKKRGQVSVKPQFLMPDDPDVSKSGDYAREKEFKLQFGVGL